MTGALQTIFPYTDWSQSMPEVFTLAQDNIL